MYRKDGQYLGFCGLRRGDDGHVDLGFRIAPPHWGHGFATEAARAALQLGFERFHLPRVIARAMPQNRASRRVLSKLGFRQIGCEQDHDGDWLRFELCRP